MLAIDGAIQEGKREMTATETLVFTLGYATPDAGQRLYAMMEDDQMVLVDIRYRAGSRYRPEWNKGHLRARYGARYAHIPALGNVNYRKEDREKGIVLKDAEAGLEKLNKLVQAGYTPILLCACKDYETCHRKVVYDMLMQ